MKRIRITKNNISKKYNDALDLVNHLHIPEYLYEKKEYNRIISVRNSINSFRSLLLGWCSNDLFINHLSDTALFHVKSLIREIHKSADFFDRLIEQVKEEQKYREKKPHKYNMGIYKYSVGLQG